MVPCCRVMFTERGVYFALIIQRTSFRQLLISTIDMDSGKGGRCGKRQKRVRLVTSHWVATVTDSDIWPRYLPLCLTLQSVFRVLRALRTS